MILELHIRNVSLIPELSLTLAPGLTILTGETGAGKSILLGALSLVLGERASSDLIRTGCETASVEGLFEVSALAGLEVWLEEHGVPAGEEGTLLIRRELYRNGRSKCYVNGSLSPLNVVQEIGERLVDLHGQHEHQSLLHRDPQRDLIDQWGGLEPLRQKVAAAYSRLRASREARERLAMDEAERARRMDLLNFQVQEIDAAQLKPGEYANLAEEKIRLAHAERLVSTVQECLEILHRREEGAVRDGLAQSAHALAGLAAFDSSMGAWADDLRAAESQVEDVVGRLTEFVSTFEADPERLETVEQRLETLDKLRRKYGESEETILQFREQTARELNSLGHQDAELERLAAEEKKISRELSDLARQLSDGRLDAGRKLSERLENELKTLGFNQAAFQVAVRPREDEEGWVAWEGRHFRCGPQGADEVEFLIAPNPGEPPKPVAKIASGGELSRIMLGLKVIAASSAAVPTMIFDEVDAGIGGATAETVGRKLMALAQQRQVVVITHLPQIARFATRHFLVKKKVEHGQTATTVDELDALHQVHELARLLAGDHITETALQHARELLAAASLPVADPR